MKYLTTLLLTLLEIGGCSSQISRCIDSNYEWAPESYSMKFGTNPNNKLHNLWIRKQEDRSRRGANKLNIIEYYLTYDTEDLRDWFWWEREYYKKQEKVLKDRARKKCNAQGVY